MFVQKNSEILLKWIDAFNEKDIKKLLSLYHKDGKHYSPKYELLYPKSKGIIKGKAALKKWWQEAFDTIPSLHYELTMVSLSEGFVVFNYERTAKKEKKKSVTETLEIKQGLVVSSFILK